MSSCLIVLSPLFQNLLSWLLVLPPAREAWRTRTLPAVLPLTLDRLVCPCSGVLCSPPQACLCTLSWVLALKADFVSSTPLSPSSEPSAVPGRTQAFDKYLWNEGADAHGPMPCQPSPQQTSTSGRTELKVNQMGVLFVDTQGRQEDPSPQL